MFVGHDGTSPEKLYSLESSPEPDVMHINAQHRAKGTAALPKEFWHGLTFPVEGKRERVYIWITGSPEENTKTNGRNTIIKELTGKKNS